MTEAATGRGPISTASIGILTPETLIILSDPAFPANRGRLSSSSDSSRGSRPHRLQAPLQRLIRYYSLAEHRHIDTQIVMNRLRVATALHPGGRRQEPCRHIIKATHTGTLQ